MTQVHNAVKHTNKDLKIIKAVSLETGAVYEARYALTEEDLLNKVSELEEIYGKDCEILIEKE